jgi:hypothetical protein
MIQTRVDMQTFIYMSNFSKGMKRCGEIWLSMAREVYTEDKRKMKTIASTGEAGTVELMQPMIDQETGAMKMANDLSEATFDVVAEVGPSSSSKRAATVRALTGMLQLTQDPETQQVITAMAMMNMEGEGLSDTNAYFRKKLLRMGVVKPTDSEAEEMMAEMQGQPQDPNTMYLQAAAEEASAKAAKARADTVETIASAELKNAQTLETFAKVSEMDGGQQQQPAQQQMPRMDEKTMLEIEAMRLENQLKRNRVEATDTQIEQLRAERTTNDSMVMASEMMQAAVSGIAEAVDKIGGAMEQLATSNTQNAEKATQNVEKAIQSINKPKRVVREKGRITRIETEE